ncbi:MAG: tetratricopeptide repeat protein [Cyanobacteriota bacterium]|nr:tetratricopeptide repeat protein [Cyanobacteriota bacterium]
MPPQPQGFSRPPNSLGSPSPQQVQHWLAAACDHHQQGNLAEAERGYQTVLKAMPHHPEALHLYGVLQQQIGALPEAIRLMQQAISLQPNYADAHYNLAIALKTAGRLSEAIASFRQALRWDPGDPELLFNLGMTQRLAGELPAAIESLRAALRLRPHYGEAACGLGIALRDVGEEEAARQIFRQALEWDPQDVAAGLGWCVAHLPIIYPDSPSILLARQGYQQALQELTQRLDLRDPTTLERAAAAVGVTQPFYLPYQGQNDRSLQTLYGQWLGRIMAARYPQWSLPLAVPPLPPRIKVGFVSGFFRDHSVWKILSKGWIEQLNRQQFSVHLFHTSAQQDAITLGIAQQVDQWVEGYGFEELCQQIREAHLHVIIYPELGMDPLSLRLATLRLAPVQCMAWGHPETSGLTTIDYFLSSDEMESPAGADHYTETLIRLPHLSTYYTPQSVTPAALDFGQWGIEPDRIHYLCAQSLFKYLPEYDQVFSRIAQQVPSCQFLFLQGQLSAALVERFRQRLQRNFAEYGLDAQDHVVILPPLNPQEYAAYNALADIYLDSIGWSGGNTTLESLPFQIPMVTLPGSLMRSRHTAAILHQMGIPELIATNVEDYIQLAIRLGKDPDYRQAIANQIAENRHRVYQDLAPITALEKFLTEVVSQPIKLVNKQCG